MATRMPLPARAPAAALLLALLLLLSSWPTPSTASAPTVLPPPATTRASQERGHGQTYGVGAHGQEEWRGEVIQVSAWAPRATLFKGFLTPAECAHLRSLARPTMAASTVVDAASGEPVPSGVRTSSGTFLEPAQDAVVARIERRLALATHLPAEHGEALHILHYAGGGKYEPHLDAFHGDDPVNARPEAGGQRVATVLMYLATPAEGGETVFPAAAARAAGPGWSDCARGGLAVAPVAGDALLFHSTTPEGGVDAASLHGSCPTTRGDKWTATRWVHAAPFGGANPLARARAGECLDGSPDCAAWAAAGECANNPGFMLATCRVSCKSCAGGEGGGGEGGGGTVAV